MTPNDFGVKDIESSLTWNEAAGRQFVEALHRIDGFSKVINNLRDYVFLHHISDHCNRSDINEVRDHHLIPKLIKEYPNEFECATLLINKRLYMCATFLMSMKENDPIIESTGKGITCWHSNIQLLVNVFALCESRYLWEAITDISTRYHIDDKAAAYSNLVENVTGSLEQAIDRYAAILILSEG